MDAGRYDARFARVFAWWVERRMFARRFHAVRVARENAGVLGGAAASGGPVIVVMNHPSWWDPLVAVLLARRFMPDREHLAPIDAAMLRTFGFFRKLGVFGIDPDEPASLRAMVEYVGQRLREQPHTTVWITPQGRLTDVRAGVDVRPGAAAVAARAPGVRVVAAAVEYVFWGEAWPEVLLRFEPCEPPGGAIGRTAAWQRAIAGAMRRNAAALAALAVAREPSALEVLVGRDGRAGAVNPVYDLWLRVRGKRAGISAEQSARREGAKGMGRIGPLRPLRPMGPMKGAL